MPGFFCGFTLPLGRQLPAGYRVIHLRVDFRFQPGSLWSESVSAARVCGKDEDRVQFPDGPLEFRDAGLTGRRLVCTQVIGVRFPGAPLTGSWSNGKTPPWHGGNRGSIPRDSTNNIWKVAGYGLPGRTANACHHKGDKGSNPLPSAHTRETAMIVQFKNMMRVRDGPPAFAPEVLSHADFRDLGVAEEAAMCRTDSSNGANA